MKNSSAIIPNISPYDPDPDSSDDESEDSDGVYKKLLNIMTKRTIAITRKSV